MPAEELIAQFKSTRLWRRCILVTAAKQTLQKMAPLESARDQIIEGRHPVGDGSGFVPA